MDSEQGFWTERDGGVEWVPAWDLNDRAPECVCWTPVANHGDRCSDCLNEEESR